MVKVTVSSERGRALVYANAGKVMQSTSIRDSTRDRDFFIVTPPFIMIAGDDPAINL